MRKQGHIEYHEATQEAFVLAVGDLVLLFSRMVEERFFNLLSYDKCCAYSFLLFAALKKRFLKASEG